MIVHPPMICKSKRTPSKRARIRGNFVRVKAPDSTEKWFYCNQNLSSQFWLPGVTFIRSAFPQTVRRQKIADFVLVAFPAEDAVIGVLPVVRIFLNPMPLEFAVDGGVTPAKIPGHFLGLYAGKKKILNLAAFLFREMRHRTPPEKICKTKRTSPSREGEPSLLTMQHIIRFCKTNRTLSFL